MSNAAGSGVTDFRLLFESAPNLCLVLTPDLRIVAVTDSYLAATMTQRQNVLGRGLFEVFPDNPDDPKADGVRNLSASLERVLRYGHPDIMPVQKYDIRRPAADGGGFEQRYWSPINSPVFDAHGAIQYIIHRVEDVTELARLKENDAEKERWASQMRVRMEHMEAEVQLRLRELEDSKTALEARDRFLAMLSHELRTPLTPVLIAAGTLLVDARLHEDLKPDVHTISRNVQLEARLIDDLLDLTRAAKGKLPLSRQPMNVRIAIGHAVSICESEITAKDLTIQTRLDATRDTIHGDMTRLQQILWNLLRNAVKFTPKGGTIRIASENDADGHLLVRIQDDGVGIAAVILPRIFEPFCQGNPTMSQRSGGIGLGLAISKALAEQHGGTLSAQSAGLGQGAEFILRFPTVDTVAAAEAGAISILPAAKPLRILVVEDDPETRRLLCKLLTVLGHQVLQAGDVASGRKALACNQLDLLLSDIGLPDGTGYDLMKEVPASLPALALTGYGMESDVQQSLAAGFREHLTKPVDVPRLQAAIHRIAGM